MPTKHPSSRTITLAIILLALLFIVGAYGLGVTNMKKEEAKDTVETRIEDTANTHTENATVPQPATTEPVAAETGMQLLQVRDDDIVIGRADAPVTIIEYSSLSCPHCAHFHDKEFSKIENNYISTGTARLVIRHFPLNAPALKGAELVDCVKGADKAKFIKVLFSMQSKWAFERDYLEQLKQIAAVGGVDGERFAACLSDKARENTIIVNMQQASSLLDISGTPSFFINGQKFDDTPDAETMGKAIEKAAKDK